MKSPKNPSSNVRDHSQCRKGKPRVKDITDKTASTDKPLAVATLKNVVVGHVMEDVKGVDHGLERTLKKKKKKTMERKVSNKTVDWGNVKKMWVKKNTSLGVEESNSKDASVDGLEHSLKKNTKRGMITNESLVEKKVKKTRARKKKNLGIEVSKTKDASVDGLEHSLKKNTKCGMITNESLVKKKMKKTRVRKKRNLGIEVSKPKVENDLSVKETDVSKEITERFAGFGILDSPSPSSLPLPRFSVRNSVEAVKGDSNIVSSH